MKKLSYIIIIAVSTILCTSCDDLLDRENYEKADTSSFPQTETDAEQLVTSCYNALIVFTDNDIENRTVFTHNMMGDDMIGAGSTSNTGAQSFDRLMTKEADFMKTAWKDWFAGLFRCNFALQAINALNDGVFKSAESKSHLLGQAYFLRAWYCWELANNFETFPLLTEPGTLNIPRTPVDEIYAQITDDLKQAISLMPAKYGYSQEAGMSGRATKYAAEALMARIWLFYTGFYGKNDMCGVSKSDVTAWLKDVRDNSKFGLEDDPREIWPYTNEYSSGLAYGTSFDTYSAQNDLHWVGNRSKETIWGVHFSYVWYATGSAGYNRLGEYYGLRNPGSQADYKCYPFGIGYTNGSVNAKMVEEWVCDPDYGTDDVRLWGSIFAVDNAEEIYSGGDGGNWWNSGCICELASHEGNDSKEVEKSMFHNKKYMVSTAWKDADKSGLYNNFFYALPGFNGSNSNQYDNRNDVVLIRYADVLLMLDELEGSVTGMNQLRQRAGLKPYDSYSLERLQKERRYELCFEGVRFNDLRRWYPQDCGEIISKNQVGGFIEYRGKTVPGGYKEITGNGMQKRYAETRGFQRIPNIQINLSNGVLTQTPGWELGKEKDWLFGNGNLPY
ncbi:MAG: RagB/SusD family nutrient uptake outer membrane protein [Marinilabiliaceae bacterium]|nr:RagB/SusD family nutrient uptake outer membrane protein [Marinilabiliaceae bacterium]